MATPAFDPAPLAASASASRRPRRVRQRASRRNSARSKRFPTSASTTASPAKPAAPRNEAPSLRSGSENGLLSRETSAAVDSAFNALAQTVLVQNARTLEDLVREMLRPMLKSWLDDNLPGMVERLVRAEIERVARGR